VKERLGYFAAPVCAHCIDEQSFARDEIARFVFGRHQFPSARARKARNSAWTRNAGLSVGIFAAVSQARASVRFAAFLSGGCICAEGARVRLRRPADVQAPDAKRAQQSFAKLRATSFAGNSTAAASVQSGRLRRP